MKKIIEGQLEYSYDGGYSDGEYFIDGILLYNELSNFDDRKIKITIEEIE